MIKYIKHTLEYDTYDPKADETGSTIRRLIPFITKMVEQGDVPDSAHVEVGRYSNTVRFDWTERREV